MENGLPGSWKNHRRSSISRFHTAWNIEPGPFESPRTERSDKSRLKLSGVKQMPDTSISPWSDCADESRSERSQ